MVLEKYYSRIISHIDPRTKLALKNNILSFVLKGWTSIVILIMVPLTLTCLGEYKNGVWLTISSVLVWIDQMDIGLGNGLRNKLTSYLAQNDIKKARMVVSSTFAMLLFIIIPVIILGGYIIEKLDVYTIFNVDYCVIPELRRVLSVSFLLVCMTFVLKIVGNVYMGMQLPAINSLLTTIGQTLSLVTTWILYKTGNASFFLVAIANTASPLIAFLLAYPYTFFYKYKTLRPSPKFVKLTSIIELGSLGLKFFVLQIAAVIQFMTANILISHFFTPTMVTPYQVTYRYMSFLVVIFGVICTPYWNATTDAYERRDYEWIKKTYRQINILLCLFAIVLLLMVIGSPLVYKLWINNKVEIPIAMTIIMAIYVLTLMTSQVYSTLLNGMGVLRIQIYMTSMTIVYFLTAWIVCSLTHNILWFMAVMCICNLPGIVANYLTLRKLLKNM